MFTKMCCSLPIPCISYNTPTGAMARIYAQRTRSRSTQVWSSYIFIAIAVQKGVIIDLYLIHLTILGPYTPCIANPYGLPIPSPTLHIPL